jgi:hypothetical protein
MALPPPLVLCRLPRGCCATAGGRAPWARPLRARPRRRRRWARPRGAPHPTAGRRTRDLRARKWGIDLFILSLQI